MEPWLDASNPEHVESRPGPGLAGGFCVSLSLAWRPSLGAVGPVRGIGLGLARGLFLRWSLAGMPPILDQRSGGASLRGRKAVTGDRFKAWAWR